MSGPRQIRIPASRLQRWLAGFEERNGAAEILVEAEGLRVRTLGIAADAASAGDAGDAVGVGRFVTEAEIRPTRGGFPGGDAAAMAAWAASPDPTGVIIVRAGGFACAVVADGRVRASKVGSRYVQGRTAAGGWSQQRYARRRQNQRDQLVDAAAEVAARVIAEPITLLVTGGDRTLADKAAALFEAGSAPAPRRGAHLNLPDPTGKLVAELPELLSSITIRMHETHEGPSGIS